MTKLHGKPSTASAAYRLLAASPARGSCDLSLCEALRLRLASYCNAFMANPPTHGAEEPIFTQKCRQHYAAAPHFSFVYEIRIAFPLGIALLYDPSRLILQLPQCHFGRLFLLCGILLRFSCVLIRHRPDRRLHFYIIFNDFVDTP